MKLFNKLRNIEELDNLELLKRYKDYLEEYFYVHNSFNGIDDDYFITNWDEWYSAKITNYLLLQNITWEYHDDMEYIVIKNNDNIILNKDILENENIKPDFSTIIDYYEGLNDIDKPNIIKNIFLETFYNFLSHENIKHPKINDINFNIENNDEYFYKYSKEFIPAFENISGYIIEDF